jgi:nucleoporin GLE1
MTGSSPATRRSRQWSSPSRGRISDLLSETRHTELSHQDALAAAQVEHERVRLAAIRVYQDHELKEENRRLREKEENIRQQQRREEERIRNEERVRAEEERLRALKTKTVPKLPPEPPQQAPAAPAATSSAQLNGSQPLNVPKPAGSVASQNSIPPGAKASASLQQALTNAQNRQTNGIKVVQPASAQLTAPVKSSPFAAPTTANSQSSTDALKPPIDNYVVIHQNLKKLRAYMAEQAKSSPALKARMGDMRREMRKSLGQFVTEKGGNKDQVSNYLSLCLCLPLSQIR